MTLNKYLNQKDPIRMPCVLLKDSELIVSSVHTDIMKNVTSRVYINHTNPLVAGVEYKLIGTRLYATDGHGNEKGASCFRISDDSKYNSYNPKFKTT